MIKSICFLQLNSTIEIVRVCNLCNKKTTNQLSLTKFNKLKIINPYYV